MSDIEEAKSGPKPPGAPVAAVECGVAELVVGRALLRVLQDLVGLVQLLELLLGGLVAGIAVGVAVLGEPAERRLDVLLARPPGSREPRSSRVVVLRPCARIMRDHWPVSRVPEPVIVAVGSHRSSPCAT